MSSLTLPGDIPGLLRRGSPGIVSGPDAGGWHYPAVVAEVGEAEDAPPWAVTYSSVHKWASGTHDRRRVALDLTDPTGRVHAVWWVGELPWPHDFPRFDAHALRVMMSEIRDNQFALSGNEWGRRAGDLALFRDLCLTLAGRTP